MDGTNNGWLAPLAVSMSDGSENLCPGHDNENVLFFSLSEPTHIGGILMGNYSKTPLRGVRDFSLWVDGAIVYRGYAERADKCKRGHAILFCGEESVMKAVGGGSGLTYCGIDAQDVECIDEGVVKIQSRHCPGGIVCPMAEGVKADLSQRPKTSSRRR